MSPPLGGPGISGAVELEDVPSCFLTGSCCSCGSPVGRLSAGVAEDGGGEDELVVASFSSAVNGDCLDFSVLFSVFFFFASVVAAAQRRSSPFFPVAHHA